MGDQSKYDVVVSIINYKTADLTLVCVQSVLDDFGDINGQVVVVDNASDDGSIEKIEAWLSDQDPALPVNLVCSQDNGGFSAGHNQGMQADDAEYYLVLNSDAVVRPGFFKNILDRARAVPKAGIIAPRLEDEDGTVQVSQFRAHSPLSEFLRGAQTGIIAKLFKNSVVALAPDDPETPFAVEWVSFACVLLNADMVADIGWMDEGYFLYFEDVEYCNRARRAGWDIVLAPDAAAVHYRGGSGPVKSLAKANKRLPDYYYVSRTRLLYQSHGMGGLIAANVLWSFGRLIALTRAIAGKGVPPIAEKEPRDIWMNVRTPLQPYGANKR